MHRRLLKDDDWGVGEALNETYVSPSGVERGLVIRGVHRIVIGPSVAAARSLRTAMAAVSLFDPVTLVAPLAGGAPAPGTLHSYSGLRSASGLPTNVHLLTAQALGRLDASSTALLVRISHSYAAGEDSALSVPVNISLSTLFADFNITSATELTLTANAPLATAPHPAYTAARAAAGEHGGGTPERVQTGVHTCMREDDAQLTVVVAPLEIRTFACVTDYASSSADEGSTSGSVVAPQWVRDMLQR